MANATTRTQIAMAPDPYRKNVNSNPQQEGAIRAPSLPVEVPKESGLKPPVIECEAYEAKNDCGPKTAKIPPTKKDSRKLFVGGLPADVTEGEFRDFFGQFGEMVDSVVMFDRETHRSRGFGFVTYRDLEVANRLLSMGQEYSPNRQVLPNISTGEPRVGRLVMRGKTCEVKPAEPKENPKPVRRGFNYHGMDGAVNVGTNGQHVFRSKTNALSNRPAGIIQASSVGYVPYHYTAAGYHQYPVYSPGYYPPYHHPSMFGAGGCNPALPVDALLEHELVACSNFNVHPHMVYPLQSYQVPPTVAGCTTAQKPPMQHSLITNNSLAMAMQPAEPGLPIRDESV